MNFRQIAFLMFLSVVIGSTIGFLLAKLGKNDRNNFSSLETVQHLNSLSDKDFVSIYPSEKHLLTLGEQTFGDRLFHLLEDRKNPAAIKIKTAKINTGKENQKNEDGQIGPEIELSNNLSYFSRMGIDIPPRYIPSAKLLQVFKNTKFSSAAEDSFGVENELIENAKEYLKKQGCKNPSFTAITEERKNRSKFFDLVKDNTFQGSTTVTISSSKEPEKTLQTKIEFNSPSHNGYDYIEVRDDKKNYLEKRVIKSDQPDAAWRYSSCEPAVILVSDKCPWSNQYVYEFKSFYLSPDSKKMIGNVYCKKPSEQDWTNVGMFDLNQSAEDRE
jgi:hypothetical protein